MIETKFQIGGYRYPVKMWKEGDRLFIDFDFNRGIIDEIRMMEGRKFHGYDEINPRKIWSIADSSRNKFQLAYLQGQNPYAPYDAPLDPSWVPMERYHIAKARNIKLFQHQAIMAAHIYQRHYPGCIVAGEMGTAKTLSCIIAMERIAREYNYLNDPGVAWYVAPRSALAAVNRELLIWDSKIKPRLLTYESMTGIMKEWISGTKPPKMVVFDESSRLKTETSQRSQAAQALADGMRDEWGSMSSVILMSGSPAPKSPVDYYKQCEIACPGFLKEGDLYKFKNTLAVIKMKEGIDRGSYPQLITWRDSEAKCKECGFSKEAGIHILEACDPDYHEFVPSVNEVARLYKRMAGLVSVHFKRDCLDLPEKRYRLIHCKPSKSILRAASLIVKTARTTIQGLTLLRELSDGFQYIETPIGTEICPLCNGAQEVEQPFEIPDTCPNCKAIREGFPEAQITPLEDEFGSLTTVCANHIPQIEIRRAKCPTCGGIGEVQKFERTVKAVDCPKYDVLKDLLDEYSEVGRVIIYGAFTGTIDRALSIVQKEGWAAIRMDQGGTRIFNQDGSVCNEKDFLSVFQDKLSEFPRVAFVAHPASAGMGLTLTASPVEIYVSNTFRAEDRIQSEDRHHRPGMDINRGATIIDIIHLESDEKVLKNLKMKRELQAMSLNDFVTLSKLGEGEERTV